MLCIGKTRYYSLQYYPWFPVFTGDLGMFPSTDKEGLLNFQIVLSCAKTFFSQVFAGMALIIIYYSAQLSPLPGGLRLPHYLR